MDALKIKRSFDEDGYLHMPGFLTREQVAEINQKLKAFIKSKISKLPSEHVRFEAKGDPSTLKMLQDLQLYDTFFADILFDSTFTRLAEVLLEEKVIGKTLEYFNKPPKIGKATPPHQDGYYFMLNPMSAVTMWMALEEVDQVNGWVSYVRGSHKKGMRDHSLTQTPGFSQGIPDFGLPSDLEIEVFFPAQPGDLLVHHALTIHRASPNTSSKRSRKALGLIYFGDSVKEDVAAKAAYVKALNQSN
ncbi:phytanoyl-CoA dioxygenase family protein [Cyclobacterium sp.]|uniref:phytanoyl-CoA dioxygenase family protein n=1 Tax=Cyclobacterium sp. TaxID=1966343 RepID=UPI0019AEAC54|nr:phytanoyl-CoA dioxygenase family protein [Cyclobacterium sp.]MBD3630463.1 phytanoyl-CoA dioxygenase family protein [Cyclobacterium sp.]